LSIPGSRRYFQIRHKTENDNADKNVANDYVTEKLLIKEDTLYQGCKELSNEDVILVKFD
jgi:hypothetical protein